MFPFCPKSAVCPGTRNLSFLYLLHCHMHPGLCRKGADFFVGGVAQTRQAKVRWQKEMKTVAYMSICMTAKNKASP